ncbi:MAG TPA: Sec-independent protein translocase protein TatB [Iamia sp.]|nr:Sec-independent protein translocase protein TatB [Iamia sp.]
MFNIGGGEMVVIFLLALLVLGPERLPKAMGQVGRAVGQMRKLSSGFQDEIRRAMDPIEAPFRPGEESLKSLRPPITDEVRVVATEDDVVAAEATNTPAEGEPAFPDLAKADPAAPDLAKAPVADDPTADAALGVEPDTEALVVDDTRPAPRRGNVTPLRPRPDDGDADQATG